jgi:hypothetical protein
MSAVEVYGSLRWEVREICIVSWGCSEDPLQMATMKETTTRCCVKRVVFSH